MAARVNRGRRRKQRGNQQQSAGSCFSHSGLCPLQELHPTPPHPCFWVSPKSISQIHEQASPNPGRLLASGYCLCSLLPTPHGRPQTLLLLQTLASPSVSTVKHTGAPIGRQAKGTAVAELWNNPLIPLVRSSLSPVVFLGGKEITSPISAYRAPVQT